MKILYPFPYLIISLHEGICPVLELSWLSNASSTEFREAALRSLALGTIHQVQGWISDDRLLGKLSPQDLNWVAQTGMVPLNRLGIRRFALLESQDELNRTTINSMYKQITPLLSYEVRRFNDLDQARAWTTDCL